MILWRPVKKREILIAFSFASAPPLVKKNVSMSPGVISASFCSQSSSRLGRHKRIRVSERLRLLVNRLNHRSSPCPILTDIN